MERALVDTVINEVEMGKRAENGFKKDTFVRMAQAVNLKNYQKPVDVTLGCFTNGTIAQVVTNSLSPLSGQHLYDGSGATV